MRFENLRCDRVKPRFKSRISNAGHSSEQIESLLLKVGVSTWLNQLASVDKTKFYYFTPIMK